MKRIFLVATIAAASFGALNAQTTELPQVRAKKMVSQLHLAVALHDQQFSKVNNAYTDFYTRLDALDAQKATLGQAAYDAKLAELKSTRDAAVKASLDAGQLSGFEAFQAKNK